VTGGQSLKRVVRTFANVAHLLVVLHLGTNTLEATPEHPLWVADQGWKSAEQIQVGDELWAHGGKRVTVSVIGQKQGQFTVNNFQVEDWHSYFAGTPQILAHNTCDTAANQWSEVVDRVIARKGKNFQTRSKEEIAFLRNEFNKGDRASYLKFFAETDKARRGFTDAQRALMRQGKVPDGLVVHHSKPLFRGGDNSYDNLQVMSKAEHTARFDELHFYPE
jgi:hypothetical protein